MYSIDEPPRRSSKRELGPVGICVGWPDLVEAKVGPATMQQAIVEWGRGYRPEVVVSNLRPGPASWLAYTAMHNRWPLVVVTVRHQLEKLPPGIAVLHQELVAYAQAHHLTTTPASRDAMVRDSCEVELTVWKLIGRDRRADDQ